MLVEFGYAVGLFAMVFPIPFYLGFKYASIFEARAPLNEFYGYLLWLALCLSTVSGYWVLGGWLFLAMLFLAIAAPSWLGGIAYYRHQSRRGRVPSIHG